MTDEDGQSPIPTSQSYSDFGTVSDNENVGKGLPNYLINPSKKGDIHDIMIDAKEEDNETGVGYDSDGDAQEIDDIDDEVHLARLFKLVSITDQESNEDIEVSDRNMVQMEFVTSQFGTQALNVHETPKDWTDPPHDESRNEPEFKAVDNPGNWSSFCYRPVFKKENNSMVYKHHCLPTGCQPVEKNNDGKRVVNRWEFHYQGWFGSDTNAQLAASKDTATDSDESNSIKENETSSNMHRIGINNDNLFPESRLGCLDTDKLKKLGMAQHILNKKDFLFFLQLVLPLGDPEKSGVEEDERLPYYSKVEQWSNLYAYQIGLGGSYGHEFKSVSLKEILHHDGCIVRDGVRGGSSGAIYRRWQMGADYDDNIAMSITFRRWLQIKRIKKLCNNDTAPKRGQPNYDPTYKYDYIFKVLVHNVNFLTKKAEIDATIDETSFSTSSPGEAGAGVTFRVMGKPGVSKGGQTVLVCDSHRVRPRAYHHRHKLQPKPDGWTASGMVEARRLVEALECMLVNSDDSATKPKFGIYEQKPHITMDNYFSGDKVLDWIGNKGFGATMTCRRDRLPSGIPSKYLHKQKTDSSKRSKVARFYSPVVAVKDFPAKDDNSSPYRRVHVSFQSTSSCNIGTVNALNQCSLTVHKRERGYNENKRIWGIEMNAGRELYLGTYSRIDSIDHLIKNCRLKYRSWKYWHSPMLHVTSLAIVVAYDIYLEVCEGKLDQDWKVNYPVDFWTFRDILSIQMLEYEPKNRKYLGDDAMRVCTKQTKKSRTTNEDDSSTMRSGRKRTRGRPSAADLQGAKAAREFVRAKSGRGANSRLCGDLSRLDKHLKSVETSLKHPKTCRVCGGDAYSICGLCGVPLHFMPSKGKNANKTCFIDYHDDCFFGLAREDNKVSNTKKSDWVYPTVAKKKENSKRWRNLESDK